MMAIFFNGAWFNGDDNGTDLKFTMNENTIHGSSVAFSVLISWK